MTPDLQSRCELLRSLHRPGAPLLLPNAWDVATARSVVAAGFPVVATTSAGVAAALGHEDHEHAPADEMLAAAARIAQGVDVPVTVDAEGGYGMEPGELVAALQSAGAAGCNLEDTDHAAGGLRDPDRHAEWLGAVRQAASDAGYGLVINARVDVFLGPLLAGAGPGTQEEHVPEALRRANAYLEAGVDCVYPIVLWEADALRRFMSDVRGPVNVVRMPPAPSVAELAALGRGPGELGALPVPGRDGSLRGRARRATGALTRRASSARPRQPADPHDGGVEVVTTQRAAAPSGMRVRTAHDVTARSSSPTPPPAGAGTGSGRGDGGAGGLRLTLTRTHATTSSAAAVYVTRLPSAGRLSAEAAAARGPSAPRPRAGRASGRSSRAARGRCRRAARPSSPATSARPRRP